MFTRYAIDAFISDKISKVKPSLEHIGGRYCPTLQHWAVVSQGQPAESKGAASPRNDHPLSASLTRCMSFALTFSCASTLLI